MELKKRLLTEHKIIKEELYHTIIKAKQKLNDLKEDYIKEKHNLEEPFKLLLLKYNGPSLWLNIIHETKRLEDELDKLKYEIGAITLELEENI